MATETAADLFVTLVGAGGVPSTTATTIPLADYTGGGSTPPPPAASTASSTQFTLVVWPQTSAQPTKANCEIMLVTDTTATPWTVVRAQEGTTAKTFVAGDYVQCAPTSGSVLRLIAQAVAGETSRAQGIEATLVPLAQKGAANGVAQLDNNGKLVAVQLPAIAMNTVWPNVNSQAAMLALNAEPGDVAIRTDVVANYMLAQLPASTLANWNVLDDATGAVQSVAGRTGNVTLAVADVSGAASQTALSSEVATARAAEAGLVPILPETATKTATFAPAIGQRSVLDYSGGVFSISAPAVPAASASTPPAVFFSIRLAAGKSDYSQGTVFQPDGATVLSHPFITGETRVFTAVPGGTVWTAIDGLNPAISFTTYLQTLLQPKMSVRALAPAAGATTAAVDGELLLVNTTSGNQTVQLATNPAYITRVFKTSTDTNTLTVLPPSGKTISGQASAVGTAAFSGGAFAPDTTGSYIKVDPSTASAAAGATTPTTQLVKAPTTLVAGGQYEVDASTRTVTDGVLNATTTVTSATAAFTANDVGRQISGTGVPAGATITAIASGTSATISAAATASASGVTLTIGGPVLLTAPAPVAGAAAISFVKSDSSTSAVSVVVTGGALINGLATQTTTVQYGGATIIPNALATAYLIRK